MTQGQQASIQVLLENLGNGFETVSFTSDPPNTWTFNFSHREPVLGPYSSSAVELRLYTDVSTAGGLYQVPIIAYFGLAKTLSTDAVAMVNIITRPDLAFTTPSLNVSEPNPSRDMLVRVTATVVNQGETVARDVFVQLYVDDIPVGQPQYMSSIEAGETEEFIMLWRTESSGLHQLRMVADFQNDIDEPDEGNNEASVIIEVQQLELKTSPGPSSLLALVAIAGAAGVAIRVKRRRH